jgi:hypothetical protein
VVLAHVLVARPAGDEDTDSSEDSEDDEGDKDEPELERLVRFNKIPRYRDGGIQAWDQE